MHQHRPGFWSFNGYLFRTASWDEESKLKSEKEWSDLLECKECGALLTFSDRERNRYNISSFVVTGALIFGYLLLFAFVPFLRELKTNNILIMAAVSIALLIFLSYLVSYHFFKRIRFEVKSSAEDDATLRETEAISDDKAQEDKPVSEKFGAMEFGKKALSIILYLTFISVLRVLLYVDGFSGGLAVFIENITTVIALVAIIALTIAVFLLCKKYRLVLKEKRWLTIIIYVFFVLLVLAYICFSVWFSYVFKVFWLDS